MKKYLVLFLTIWSLFLFFSCDRITNPYPPQAPLDLDTTLYPGNWADYVANEWPTFTANTNINRNILIEDYTGHKCIFCPAAADLAHSLETSHDGRIFISSMHVGPLGIGDFQTVSPPEYPVDFTNPNGIEIGTYFGIHDGGFSGNPRGTINRFTEGGNIFQNPNAWTGIVNTMLAENVLKVNMQSALNYYPQTHGAFLHVEVEKLDPTLTNELGVVAYVLEDSLVGDQKMSDNSHNPTYIHRDIHRGNLNGQAFGRVLGPNDLQNGKYYVNYSFVVPNQLDNSYNAENMHVLIYVYDRSTWEIYQVIRQNIIP
ncbi:MAG: Omp28-related outer membrane protein [Crocinitomicaceae bacterium]|jgi:hypothetical protein